MLDSKLWYVILIIYTIALFMHIRYFKLSNMNVIRDILIIFINVGVVLFYWKEVLCIQY